MLNPSEGNRYPNLRQVLNQRLRALYGFTPPPALVTGLSGMFILFVLSILAIAAEELAVLPFILVPAYFLWVWIQKSKLPRDDVRKAKIETIKRMIECLEKNRLEHDISTANLNLLEGCAIAYREAQTALDQWKPAYAQEVKVKIEQGVVEAIDEAVLAHRDALPQHPTALPVGVQLGKVADTFLFGRNTSGNAPIEPAFSRTRVLADQLRDAAHAVEEAASQQLGANPTPVQSPSLNDALGDLRMIQQAEEEMRQDLRGS